MSSKEFIYNLILHLVSLEFLEGLYYFTLIICFTMLPLNQRTCSLDFREVFN